MTVSTTTTTITYLGNGNTTTFTFPFIGVSSADLEVIYTDTSGGQVVLNPAVYTLVVNPAGTGQLWGIGGSVTYPVTGTPIQSGTQLTINRIVPYTQNVSIDNQGAFYPQAVEQGLDLLELQVQQIEDAGLRALRVPVSDPYPNDLPGAVQRANGLLGFDSSGTNPVIYQTGSTNSSVAAVTISHANTPYTSTGTPNVIYADAIAGVITINLPTAASVKQIDISKVDSTGNVVTIAAAGGQTINGSSTTTLSSQYQSIILISNGINSWTVFSGSSSSSSGGLNVANITSANTPYTVSSPINVVLANTTSANIVVNLPSAATVTELYIAKTDSSVHTVTITPTGGQTINGASTYTLTAQYQTISIISNGGTAWTIFGGGANASPSGLSVAKITSANSPYSVVAPVNVVVCNATAGSITVNLPAAVTVQAIYVCRTDNVYANSVTIIANGGGGTIEGTGSYVLQYQNQGIMCISDGNNNWNIFGQIKPVTDPLTPNIKSVNNIFNLINSPSLIAQIQAGTAGYLDSYFTSMIAVGGTWFLPQGYYHLANKLDMTPGMQLWGTGNQYSDTPSLAGTVIYLGGNPGEWGMNQSNPVSGSQFEAYKLKDICFLVTQQGIRWNRIDGGFTDDSSSQGYMMRPRIEGCAVLLDTTPGEGIGLQMSKCFDFVIRDCNFSNFSTSCDLEGSDIGVIEGCRFDSDTSYSIKAVSHATFGSNLVIFNNDFNDPYGFIDTTYLDILIDNNHMEFDRDQGRATAAIRVSGNAFITKIHNNRIEPGSFVTNWLSVTNDVNRYLVSVFDNIDPTAPALMGNVSYPAQLYFNNSSGRSIVRHGGNTNGDQSFPMNWVDGLQVLPPGYYARVTPSTAGVDVASVLNPSCEFGAFTIRPNADTTQKMQISDWAGYGLPANTMKGPVTISVITAAGAAGQVGSWQILDNGSSVSTGTITHAVANQLYNTTLVTSHTFTGPVQLKLWNADTGTGERFYVYSADFKIG